LRAVAFPADLPSVRMLESREINDSYRMQRTILSIALGLIFNISASPAWALNLGKGVLGSTLGQP
jgi:hypothetical protein